MECPKCDKMKNNFDAASIKIHLFQHYRSHWEDKFPKDVPENSLEIFCGLCKPQRRFKSSTPRGVRGSVMCHWALQHEQLKEVLKNDEEVDDEFIDDLYNKISFGMNKGPPRPIRVETATVGHTATTTITYNERDKVFSAIDKNYAVNKSNKGKRTKKYVNKSKKIVEPKSDTSEDEEEDPLAKRRLLSGPVKRSEINFTMEDLEADGDSDDWSEEEHGFKRRSSPNPNVGPKRVLPRRSSARQKGSYLELIGHDESDDDEEEEEV